MTNIDLTKNIKSIVIGIRISKNFELFDKIGSIAEEIVRGTNTPFDSKYFPSYQDFNREVIFFNKDKPDDYLFRISVEDILFKHTIEVGNYDKDYKWIETEVINFIVKDVFVKFGIKKIKRIGILNYLEFSEKTNIAHGVNKMINKDIELNTLDLRFSEKIFPFESVVKKDKNDYKNLIYTFSQKEDKSLNFAFDLQYFFEPPLESMIDGKLNIVMKDSKEALFKKFDEWINFFIFKKNEQ